jgi:hypothetical protein
MPVIFYRGCHGQACLAMLRFFMPTMNVGMAPCLSFRARQECLGSWLKDGDKTESVNFCRVH